MKINYVLPKNIKKSDFQYFKFDYKYQDYQHIQIKKHENVFINHYGLVLKKFILVDGCAPNIKISNYDNNFYLFHWKKVFEQFLVCKYGKSLKYINLFDGNYFIIHSPWFSYYFWVTECLPRLIKVYESYNNEILIYPYFFDDFKFVKETLILFPKLKIKKIPVDNHLFVKNLYLPEVKPWTIMFRPEDVIKTNRLLIKNKVCNLNFKNICITREGTHRSFENFKEVREILTKYNFEFIKMEDYSFFEQIGLINNANIVIGISGAGHTNIHFMKKGSKFLDITAKKNVETKKYKFHFWKLACIVGVDYYYQFADISNRNLELPYFNRNIIINLALLEDNLKKMINE